MATERPSYTILTQTEDFELRRYDPQIVAQTWVTGTRDVAGRQAFKTLAGYIFGKNTAVSGDSSKISMTAPVMMQPQDATTANDSDGNNDTGKDNEITNINNTSSNDASPADESAKIAMTTPVMMQKAPQDNDKSKWRVQFVMPSHYTMQTLPKPNNPDITLTELPVETFAVVKFSGMAGAETVAEKTAALQAWMQSQNLTATGTPELARYNPPWTLPFMRHNEVMIVCQKK